MTKKASALAAERRARALKAGAMAAASPDEMAAGLIHEPGTDGDFLARIGTDAVKWANAFVDAAAMDNPLGRQLRQYPHSDQRELAAMMIGWFANAIEAGRAAGISFASAADDLEEPRAVSLARLQHELTLATRQRDFAMRQIDSLVQRLAGTHVAAGSFDMAAAQGFVQKEILPINAVLTQLGQPKEDM